MIKKWLTFSIQSHLFLAISAFVFSIGILDGNNKALHFSVALSVAIFGVYNLNRLNKLKTNQLSNDLIVWYQRNSVFLKFTAIVCLFSSASIYAYLIGRQPLSLLFIAITGSITVLYIYKINKINLRQIPGTKAIWISIVWTLISVMIPKLTMNSFRWSDLHYFILFLALTIPGDLRDSEIDSHKMRTIPQILGSRKASLLFYLLITSFLVMNFLFNNINIIGISLVLLFFPILISKHIPFRHELMDGMLLILGIGYLVG
jgi:hypothetical protein